MSSGLITILLFFGFTFLSWLFGKLKEQAEVNKQRQATQRRREEMLRTGRGVQPQPAGGPYAVRRPEGQPQAAMSAEELASRRQAQLRAMREEQLRRLRQGAQRPGQGPGQGAAPTGGARSTSPQRPAQPGAAPARSGSAPVRQVQTGRPGQGPPSRTPQQPARRASSPPGAAPTSRKQQELLRRQADAARRARETRETPGADALAEGSDASLASRFMERSAPPAERKRTGFFGGRPLTAEELRRAVVINEIFNRPVGMRDAVGGADPYRF